MASGSLRAKPGGNTTVICCPALTALPNCSASSTPSEYAAVPLSPNVADDPLPRATTKLPVAWTSLAESNRRATMATVLAPLDGEG